MAGLKDFTGTFWSHPAQTELSLFRGRHTGDEMVRGDRPKASLTSQPPFLIRRKATRLAGG